MKFFVDTADIGEIEKLADTGMIDGVTTNPSLIAKSGQNILDVTKQIAALVSGPVSAEVTATDYETMVLEGRKLGGLAKNIAIKVPLTVAGLKACKTFREDGFQVNVTLCFSASQALLAAKAGASFVSPFVGRLDDLGVDGMRLIENILAVYNAYPTFDTEVLVASVRSVQHVERAARMGAHVATLPPKIIWALYNHTLTDHGLSAFLKDWETTNQSIL